MQAGPPKGLFFEVAIEPCEDGVAPEDAFAGLKDPVVFAFDDDHLDGPFEQPQGGVHLVAFDGGDVGVVATVEEEEGSMDLVGGE